MKGELKHLFVRVMSLLVSMEQEDCKLVIASPNYIDLMSFPNWNGTNGANPNKENKKNSQNKKNNQAIISYHQRNSQTSNSPLLQN